MPHELPAVPAPSGPRVPLRLKLGGLAAALVLVPLPLVGFVLLDRAEGALEHEVRERSLAVADDVSASIERELASAVDGLDSVGRLLGDPTLPEDATIELAARSIEGEQTLDHVGIYDAAGARIDVLREGSALVTMPETLGADLREQTAAGGVALGNALPTDGAPRVLVVVPLRAREGGQLTGYVASQVSLEGLQARVEAIASRRFGGLPDALFVVDAEGRVLAASEPERLGSEHTEHPLVREISAPRFGAAFVAQRLYEDASAPSTLGTLVSVPSHRWAVIVQVPEAVAFAPLRALRWMVVGTVAVIALVALLIGLWMARSITAPIGALVELAQRLGRRELGATVAIRTGDELEILGGALSEASRALEASERTIREEEAIRGDLGRYLPKEIVERVIAREQDMGLGGVRREITVLFADVVSFTPLSERHEPEVVVTVLNELFTILTEVVFRHGGTVDKLIGDSIMALWGAPTPIDDHAARAVAAAEDMLRWLETGNATWRARYGITLRLAIGVHTGEAVVGNIGSSTRMAYTAIGDVVNVAARLEAKARPQQILVTQATRDAAGDAFETLDAGEHSLAGRSGVMRLYEVRV